METPNALDVQTLFRTAHLNFALNIWHNIRIHNTHIDYVVAVVICFSLNRSNYNTK